MFGVGEHFAGSIDDSGARSRSLPFLRGDLCHRVRAVGFDAMGEEQSLLGEAALNFGAQGGLPCAA